MKCIAAVVMMAVAVQASYYHEPAPAISTYSSYPSSSVVVKSAPVAYSYAAPAQVVSYQAAPAQVGVYADHYSPKAQIVSYQAAPTVYSAPAPVVYSAPAPVYYKSAPAPVIYKAAPAPVIVKTIAQEAKYTAVNRGALHEASLPGHALSQNSVNLEPAPGTH